VSLIFIVNGYELKVSTLVFQKKRNRSEWAKSMGKPISYGQWLISFEEKRGVSKSVTKCQPHMSYLLSYGRPHWLTLAHWLLSIPLLDFNPSLTPFLRKATKKGYF